MAECLVHRGPNGGGVWTSPSGAACFAHRRLSVIDLETGHQPFVATDNQSCLVFNGEIYNYLELRQELQVSCSEFRTSSDTEVLFKLLQDRGTAALDSIVGMFAFAYWDENRRELILARDRVGKKPLYYTVEDDCLYFCSTLPAIKKVIPGSRRIDKAAVSDFLNLGYVPAPQTIYEDVWKLSAATYVCARQDKCGPVSTKYWSPVSTEGDSSMPQGVLLDQLESLLVDSVRIRLRSDVPLGVFLSGGVDSSLVTALATQHSATQIKTFTISFTEGDYDESHRARAIANHLGTEHHEYKVHSSIFELLPEILQHTGEPFADSASLPLWHLCKQASSQITVALLGDGGDEGFAGYDWYRTGERINRIAKLAKWSPISALVGATGKVGGRRWRRLSQLIAASPCERFADLRCQFGSMAFSDIFDAAFLEEVSRSHLAHDRIAGLHEEYDIPSIYRMQYADLRTYLADCLLPKVDVCSMAHSVEARAPLLDHRVLELAYQLPARVQSAYPPKLFLRKILRRYIPPELTDGPKKGFSVPLREWFNGELGSRIDSLCDGVLMDTGWFRRAGVASLIQDHRSNKRDNSDRLFNLLVLNTWLEQ